jgi:tetratricopeptide (TPR) repeat protein
LGEKARALELYEQALPLRRAIGDRAGEAATLNNIGSVHHDLGDKTRALEFYEQALPLRCAVGDLAGEAFTLFNIAMVHDAAGNTAKAVALLERVVALDEAIQHPNLESDQALLAHLRIKQSDTIVATTPTSSKLQSRLIWLILFAVALVAAAGWLIFSR